MSTGEAMRGAVGVELVCIESDGRIDLIVTGALEHARLELVPSALSDRARHWQSIAGTFVEHDGAMRFAPKLPLVPGMSYSLLVDGSEATRVQVPVAVKIATSTVISIHPSSEEVPINVLRLYISFSDHMSEGSAAHAVYVKRADTDDVLDDAFLQMEPELWDRSRQRLTLLFDPARIKRGIGPEGVTDYPLVEGGSISVVVDESFRDGSGRALRAGLQRRYRIGPAIRTRVDPSTWQLAVPEAGSDQDLVVVFDRPMDRALLARFIAVVDGTTGRVPGEARIGEGDRVWHFRPSARWRPGRYAVRVDSRLEDVAGNSIRRVFDRDLDLPEDDPLDVKEIDRVFEIS